MGFLAPSQSSRLVSCFALTQSVSLDLVSSILEKIFVVSAPVFKTTGTASLIGVSRKSCTRFTFHLLPYSEPGLHMRSRSERSSVGCSGSEQDKAQNLAIKSISGHRGASSSSYKRGSVSLLGGCSTPNTPIITAFSPPSCATDEVYLHVAARTLRSSSASHPGSRVSPARLVVNGPNFNCLWAWPSTTKEESGHLLSQSIPTGLISLASLKISKGFLGIYVMRVLLYQSYRMNCSVVLPTLLPVLSSSSTKERILLPCLFSVKGDDSSVILPRVCFNLLTGLSLCIAVCTGSEGANEKTTSVLLVGESWLSTSQYKVTKSQLYDFVVHASSTHPSFGLNSLSSSDEDLLCLILIAVVAYVYFPRRCLILSGYCSFSS
ncbi:hypothetical protein Rs2_09378 [Raphanus sativus]|nr:hypothetical protein Rs2_49559 [Raphanus sativus]KAJ4905720.1 hypothetical protein Rs2_09378 [Raphanus sativus]